MAAVILYTVYVPYMYSVLYLNLVLPCTTSDIVCLCVCICLRKVTVYVTYMLSGLIVPEYRIKPMELSLQ